MTAVEKIIEKIDNELQTLESLHGKEIFGRKVGLAFAKRVANQAKEMQNEQIKPLFNYIEEVMNMCNRREFPSEKELFDLYFKAEQILLTFKSTIK